MDIATIIASVAHTGRLLIVDEDYLSFGLSGEIVTRVIEELGPNALRQVRRLAVPDVPIPGALSLERAVVPNLASILMALEQMSNAS